MVMKKGQNWISLPLAKSQQSNPIHLDMEMRVTQLDKMLKKEEVGTSFPHDHLIGQGGSRRYGNIGGTHDNSEAKVGSSTTI